MSMMYLIYCTALNQICAYKLISQFVSKNLFEYNFYFENNIKHYYNI